ncbi:MAG TPA: sialidase family protein [Pirellulaceae bacterium]|jgi:predicted neuraminidase|nr:sialidase family protein [Pirellulaceae bacterium]
MQPYRHCRRSSTIGKALAFILAIAASTSGFAAEQPGIVLSEFIFNKAAFPQCHASTIAETKQGLVVAWFGGTREKNPDVGIWLSRYVDSKWTVPVEVVNGVQNESLRYPCWNPVLFTAPDGKLLLFYKVGPSPSSWWGLLTTSDDHGESWGPGVRLPGSFVGPIKNKPILLTDGRLLCGTSTEDQGWRVHMEWTADQGKSWNGTKPLNDGKTMHAIQPTILVHGDAQLQILCRGRGTGRIVQANSSDSGRTWSALTLTELPNPNSGIDAATLRTGRHVLIYNHTERGRSPLNLAVSVDGQHWQAGIVLEDKPGEYSYPAVIQSADGLVHVTYTWKRSRVKHVIIDPTQLKLRSIEDGVWPD